jgi:outer membrane protein OmpA-like peptidoglycan-associated protein
MRRLCLSAVAFCAAIAAQAPAFAQAPDRNFVVFFELWSGNVDAAAQGVIDKAAAAAKVASSERVVVTGTADPTGSARANALVSALRAQMVADGLVASGVSADRIDQNAYGATDYTFSGIEARRVVISIGGK